MRAYCLIVVLALLLLFQFGLATAIPLETTMSQRYSVRTFDTQAVSSGKLLMVLKEAYGYVGINRVLPKIGNAYSLIIYAVNATRSYRYSPDTNSLTVHNLAVNKETIRSYDSSWPSDANVVLVIVWDKSKMSNPYFASAEAGCLVQNVYLAAITENLGTTCVGDINSGGLQGDLGLSSDLTPILVMPLGYPTSSYPTSTPDYGRMTGNLPRVQTSGMSFTEALNSIKYTQTASTHDLSSQEISQLLWAAYGYSSTGHRTTPSANGIYPLIIYMANATGTYRYTAESHSITQIQAGDKRSNIAAACGNQQWAASASAIFLITLNNGGTTGDGGVLDHEYIEVDAGCVVQQILLEASATNLEANVVANGLEDYNGDGAQTLRSILSLNSSIIPLYIIPVGRVSETTTPTPTSPSTTSTSPNPSPYQPPSSSPSASPSAIPTLSPSATPTPGQQNPEFPIEYVYVIAGVSAFLVAALAIMLFRRRK
jgi:SagB-type dehydrogenase family enzyme